MCIKDIGPQVSSNLHMGGERDGHGDFVITRCMILSTPEKHTKEANLFVHGTYHVRLDYNRLENDASILVRVGQLIDVTRGF